MPSSRGMVYRPPADLTLDETDVAIEVETAAEIDQSASHSLDQTTAGRGV